MGLLKLSLFGHDTVVFHEHEILKKEGPFHRLGKEKRDKLMQSLNILMEESNFLLIPVVIDKAALKKSGMDAPNVYHLAMQYGLEMLYKCLDDLGQQGLKTHVIG